jgi:hypothetical protein
MGESSPVKTRLSLTNSTRTPLRVEALDQGTQIVEVACEPVHAVHNHGVPFTGEPQQLVARSQSGLSKAVGSVVRRQRSRL